MAERSSLSGHGPPKSKYIDVASWFLLSRFRRRSDGSARSADRLEALFGIANSVPQPASPLLSGNRRLINRAHGGAAHAGDIPMARKGSRARLCSLPTSPSPALRPEGDGHASAACRGSSLRPSRLTVPSATRFELRPTTCLSLPSPVLGEAGHRGLARRLVIMRRRPAVYCDANRTLPDSTNR
jgi:hypothetical protein